MRVGPFLCSKGSQIGVFSCLFCCAFFLAACAGKAKPQSSQNQSSTNTPQLDPAIRAGVAEKFAQALADNYAYADKGAAMAAAIRAKLNAKDYDAITSPFDFANALERDARAVVDDRHIEVNFTPGPMQMPVTGEGASSLDDAIPQVRILDGNIGYIVVNAMVADPSSIAAAFAFVHSTDALIVDLRGNSGGYAPVASLCMSYLSEGSPRLLDTVHWRNGAIHESRSTNLADRSYGDRKPVFILTSHHTFSAAEALAYDVKSFKRGTIVGETTGGGANPSMSGGSGSLGHGFVARIPTGYVVNAATGTNWEGVGVKPDVEVPADEAFAKAWSLALARVSANAANAQSRDLLAALSSAKLDGQLSFATTQLIGRYVSKSGDATMVITEKDGNLYGVERYHDGETTNIVFQPVGGDRYARAGFPDGFSLTFTERDGKIELVESQPPPRQSSILGKQ